MKVDTVKRAIGAAVIAGVLSAGNFAFGASRYDRSVDRNDEEPAVRYVYLGQSQVALPIYPASDAGPYAFTGNRSSALNDQWNRQGQWMNTGQGRIYIPSAR